MSCAVCLELFNSIVNIPKILPCGHSFCDSCLKKMVTSKYRQCPTCRIDFNGRLPFVTNYAMIGE